MRPYSTFDFWARSSFSPLGRKPARISWFVAATIGAALLGPVSPGGAQPPEAEIPSPETYFGYRMGSDRKLIHYDKYLPYLDLLAKRSDRVEISRTGTTTRDREMVMLLISTPENLAKKERYREISAKLNDPRDLSESQIEQLIAEGKVVLLVTLNIHSTEIAASQMALEWAYDLATGGDDTAARYLKDVIVILVPSMNPDGQAMITDWYQKYVDTRFEGGTMPWLYHPYAGHDNNRDWFMLNLPETRAVNRLAYHEWFPQILVDEHQMGATGPRAFVPPYTDPVSDNVHPLIHRGSLLIGANMSMDLEQNDKSGVIYGYSFDAYWPGGTRSTPWWKNTVGILTEVASARLMSPIYVDPGELSGGRKGLPDYKAQVNFPNPWPGGWWRPRDIVEYELIISNSALKTSSLHREDFLRNRARMSLDAVRKGETEPPYGYILPPEQHDPGTASKLVDLLIENGVEVFYAPENIVSNGQTIARDSFVILAAQPFRSFLVEMMEPQVYPEVRVGVSSDEIYRPYDVTAWTLPYLMGVRVEPLKSPTVWSLDKSTGPVWSKPSLIEGTGDHWALSPKDNDSYTAVLRLLTTGEAVTQVRRGFSQGGKNWPPGTFLTQAPADRVRKALSGLCTQASAVSKPTEFTSSVLAVADPEGMMDFPFRSLRIPRVGIYQSWLGSMDEGWTRYVLDQFEFPVTVLHDKDIQSGNLVRAFDAIILPDLNRTQLVQGKWSSQEDRYQEPRPDPYNGGLGKNGVKALSEFVKKGGSLITLGSAADLAIKDLNIPVRNITSNVSRKDFSTPGTLLNVVVDNTHPLGYGMPRNTMVYHTNDPVLGTQVPGPDRGRSVVIRFSDGDKVVASGWAEGAKRLERKAALVEASSGEGKVVLFSFRPQHRAQTHGTYRMIFNALFDAGVR